MSLIRSKAILNLAPGANFVEVNGEIDWQSPDIPQPSEEAITAEMTNVENQEPLRKLRKQRNYLLTKCDWTQFPDVPESTRLAWQTYRQELRDITDTYTSLDDVVWPTKPE